MDKTELPLIYIGKDILSNFVSVKNNETYIGHFL